MMGMRLDKWLWAARFFKTRSLATQEIGKGHVHVNGQACKASRELRLGDLIDLRQGTLQRTVIVLALSDARGPSPIAQALYEETAASVARREEAAKNRQAGIEPSLEMTQGRPTKKNRRKLVEWTRWSASIEPPQS